IRKFAARNHTDKLDSLPDKTFVATNKFTEINIKSAVTTAEIPSDDEIRLLQMANYVESSMKEERE
ncbi:MAG: hypothetical protein J6Y41_04800, partial [Bacteroidaceae bacterium]|nr:hypothetical protein [Bacteroidaceae bacterium]